MKENIYYTVNDMRFIVSPVYRDYSDNKDTIRELLLRLMKTDVEENKSSKKLCKI